MHRREIVESEEEAEEEDKEAVIGGGEDVYSEDDTTIVIDDGVEEGMQAAMGSLSETAAENFSFLSERSPAHLEEVLKNRSPTPIRRKVREAETEVLLNQAGGVSDEEGADQPRPWYNHLPCATQRGSMWAMVIILVLVLLMMMIGLMFNPNVHNHNEERADVRFQTASAAYWELQLEEDPFMATFAGVEGAPNGQVPVLTMESFQTVCDRYQKLADVAEDIDASAMDDEMDDMNARVLQLELQQRVARCEYLQFETMCLSTMVGPQVDLPEVAQATSLRSEDQCDLYLQRLQQFPTYIQQTISLLQIGIHSQLVQPFESMQNVLEQLNGQCRPAETDVSKSVFFQPFLNYDEAKCLSQQAAAKQVITDDLLPAFCDLLDFTRDTYLPACRHVDTPIGLSGLPLGNEYYQVLIEEFTNDPEATPETVHQLGLSEIEKISAKMTAATERSGFQGSFQEYADSLRSDPSYIYEADELIKEARALGKIIDAKLPQLFEQLPRCPYAVIPVPDSLARTQPAGYYNGPDSACTRPGQFNLNTYGSKVPSYLLRSLLLHESVPGHHLQIALQAELEEQPLFRVNGDWTAFIEGWALYAESLGEEMQLYSDPAVDIGRLSDDMLRACRLVVDTGIHYYGWTRQQSIDLIMNNTALDAADIESEVDRYILWPGQAVSYKSGQLAIRRLRSEAAATLNDDFDLRAFHNRILAYGSLPLSLLDESIHLWVDSI